MATAACNVHEYGEARHGNDAIERPGLNTDVLQDTLCRRQKSQLCWIFVQGRKKTKFYLDILSHYLAVWIQTGMCMYTLESVHLSGEQAGTEIHSLHLVYSLHTSSFLWIAARIRIAIWYNKFLFRWQHCLSLYCNPVHAQFPTTEKPHFSLQIGGMHSQDTVLARVLTYLFTVGYYMPPCGTYLHL